MQINGRKRRAQTIHAGGTLVITNTAVDSDVPVQTLTFSLDPGAPAGASIDATNGVFVWGTTAAQANNTDSATVRVTDNGTPCLSDAKSFTISVAASLAIESFLLTNNQITITWNAIPGVTYRLQYQDSLNDGPWNSLTPDVTSVGTTASKTDSVGTGQRFYRVLVVD